MQYKLQLPLQLILDTLIAEKIYYGEEDEIPLIIGIIEI